MFAIVDNDGVCDLFETEEEALEALPGYAAQQDGHAYRVEPAETDR